MREISFDESKKIMIKTLQSIDKCCRENDIKYSICWGTMIGAIRHQGFIPWDDDIDVMMPRDDYNRFLDVYDDEDYEIYTPRKTKNCIQLLTKISNSNTRVIFNNHDKSLFGLWISIFPYDNAPDTNLKKWEKRRTLLVNLYHFKTVRYLKSDSILKKAGKCLLKLFVLPWNSFELNNKVEACLTKYNHSKTRNICIWDNGYGFTRFFYFPAELFEECIDVDFDGVPCKIIKGYDTFMRMYYGDYMQLPPIEKQVPSHDYKAYFKK